MQTEFRRILLSLLLAAAATPALAQLEAGEQATPEQVATGEVPVTPSSEAETVYRGLSGTMVARQWTAEAARNLLAYIERVGEEGLVPADYGAEALRSALASGDRLARDQAATDSFLKLSAGLALGEVPIASREDWHMKDPDLDGAAQFALMERAIATGDVSGQLDSLLPTHPQYAELKGVLARAEEQATRDKAKANLERWRWLPRDLGPRYVIVNVPAYTVALVEEGRVVTRHRAVVGTPKTATPALSAVATGVIFNPWWEVPKSIAPEVRGKRGYVAVKGEDGVVQRYRQPPGPANALGRVKVVMPNNYAIYLHDTPAKALFKKPARAFSHGCIRTENALDFARALLANPEWDKAKINETIAAGKTLKVDGTIPTPVYITYFTAAASAEDGGIVSYRDVYSRDEKVVTALNDRRDGTALASAAPQASR
jgi:murein L,D-transpeptidase YcbB/YkuD